MIYFEEQFSFCSVLSRDLGLLPPPFLGAKNFFLKFLLEPLFILSLLYYVVAIE